MKVKSIVKFLVGVGILVLIVVNLGYENLVNILTRISYIWLIPAALSYILGLCLVSWRLNLMFSGIQMHFLFSKLFWSNMLGMLLAEITPGKVGYLSVTVPLSQEKPEHKKEILAVILATQVLDFLLRFSLAIVLIAYFIATLKSQELHGALTAALIFSVLIFIVLIVVSRWQKIKRLTALIPFKREFFLKTMDSFQEMHKKTLTSQIVLLTIASWIATSARWIFIGKALSLGISPFLYIFLQPVILSVSFLPITVGGLGIVETFISAVFVSLGVGAEKAFAFAIVDRVVLYAVEITGLKEVKSL
ncbi:MAG: flippase-like domain-containing protein [Methanomicrobia archaeon]|nr:flippase-like domain-containing protein [Methanomicrobia archaeon]MCK4310676.1 flippase-like domain-containing protein [Methanomicrobia archaeon]MCK4433126.1 flippase-like domain-containing protein [Methanomicrobia archaeon]MCK4636516.1 flippase-like domain-containing protein [Methanomicrobia archaeon]